MTKWEFIMSYPEAKDIIARELANAYVIGLESGHHIPDEEYQSLVEHQETFIKTLEDAYKKDLDSPKADYAGVCA